MAYVILHAPSALGLSVDGVEGLGEALVAAGLAERLGARVAGRADAPAGSGRRDPETQVLNGRALAEYARTLADAVGPLLSGPSVDGASGEVPLVLGGDCSILLGTALALRRRERAGHGRPGLLFLDGHLDFAGPEDDPNGEAASMELGLATGAGPPALADLEGLGPLLRREDVAALGMRDGLQAEGSPERVTHVDVAGLWRADLPAVRRQGAEAAARAAVAHLTRPGGPDHFWIHLDADVLDDALMPAVDYHMDGGLTWDELSAVLRVAVATGRVAGVEVAIFNPRLDARGDVARRFVDALVAGLAPAA